MRKKREYMPVASHLLYPQILDGSNENEEAKRLNKKLKYIREVVT